MRKEIENKIGKLFFDRKFVKQVAIVFLTLCSVFFSSCVTTSNGGLSLSLDLNYLFFGKEDNIAWTNIRLGVPPQEDGLVKLSNFSREASNLYRYAERVNVNDNTWYQVFAKGGSVYYVYKNVERDTYTYTYTYYVYKSKYAMPTEHPVITPEELRKVELAYAETSRVITQRGKRLVINTLAQRNDLIQKYQGSPNASAVRAAKNTRLEIYDIRRTSQEEIVALTMKEPNDFLKVRMIHDWVADIFAYDYDLLALMESGYIKGNAEFTLGALIERQRGVCYEYGILFWFLLDAAGIDTYLICDYINGHAYNMAVINGTGYIIDTTWDSGNWYQFGKITQFKRMINKDYFMPDISQSYRLRGW